MPLKKILIPIIIAIVVLTAFFGLFGIKQANAIGVCVKPGFPDSGQLSFADNTCPAGWVLSEEKTKAFAEAGAAARAQNAESGSCNPLNWNFDNCVLSAAAGITYYAIWTPANLFLAIGGWAMDASISLTITGTVFSGMANDQNGAVTAGWSLSRDIINIFLIFILLYIAIATILQVSGYGAKELLTILIVIAFLVNFSLVITKMIIDASNVLAVGFYNAFPQTTDSTTGQTKIQVSKSFKDAFDLDKIVYQIEVTKETKTPQNTYIVQFLTYLLGAGIAAIAGFIFMVFAVLFVIRMVSLLILMILAPLAFGAMILPSTKSHATKWWSTLFSQAFFAPAGLFMLWLAAKMSASMHSLFQDVLGATTVANMLADAQNNKNWENIAKFIFQFVIIAIILIAAIIISKQMGAMGADSTIKGLKKAGAKAQGYAGRIGRYGGTRLGGMAAEKVLKGEGRAAAFVRSIPLATRGLAGVSALEEKRKAAKAKEYEKAYGTYSITGLEAMLKTPVITPRKREAIEIARDKKIKEEAKRQLERDIRTGKAQKPKDIFDQFREALTEKVRKEEREKMEAEKEKTETSKPSSAPKTV